MSPSLTDEALYAKIRRRLAPLLILLYLIAFLDRVNISFAALTMNRDLHISNQVFGWGAGIFFLGYLLFAVPANMALERLGVRRWIAILMVTWSIISASMAFVPSASFYLTARFLLGAAEAGFFPGIILYLTVWLPAAARARVNALFILAVPLANVVGAPASTFILRHAPRITHMLGLAGLKDWQLLFLLEALPALILGLLVPILLAENPHSVGWLSAEDKSRLAATLAAEDAVARLAITTHATPRNPISQALATPGIYLVCAINFAFATGLYALGFWVPKILTARGVPLASLGWWTAVPFALGALGMLAASSSSDRTGDRRWHLTIAFVVAATGLAAATLLPGGPGAVIGLSIAAIGVFAIMPVLWTVATARMTTAARPIGIAFVNAFGNIGGFIGPVIIGTILTHTGSYRLGLLFTAAMLLVGATLSATQRHSPSA